MHPASTWSHTSKTLQQFSICNYCCTGFYSNKTRGNFSLKCCVWLVCICCLCAVLFQICITQGCGKVLKHFEESYDRCLANALQLRRSWLEEQTIYQGLPWIPVSTLWWATFVISFFVLIAYNMHIQKSHRDNTTERLHFCQVNELPAVLTKHTYQHVIIFSRRTCHFG